MSSHICSTCKQNYVRAISKRAMLRCSYLRGRGVPIPLICCCLKFESQPNHRPCRGMPPLLDWPSKNEWQILWGRAKRETRHLSLVSELLLLKSLPNCRPCRVQQGEALCACSSKLITGAQTNGSSRWVQQPMQTSTLIAGFLDHEQIQSVT
jgi:hypothetical protein